MNTEPLHAKNSRMWFHPDLLKTNQLEVMIEANKSEIYYEIKLAIDAIILEHGLYVLEIIAGEINDYLYGRYSANKIANILNNEFKLKSKKKSYLPYYKTASDYRGKDSRIPQGRVYTLTSSETNESHFKDNLNS